MKPLSQKQSDILLAVATALVAITTFMTLFVIADRHDRYIIQQVERKIR
jgi:hypothetical protein